MVEKLLENVINEMAPHLNPDQMEHLGNVLSVNFHGKEIQEQCTELTDTGVMRERRGIKMSTMQTRLHYLSSFWDFLITEELAHSNLVKKVGVLKLWKTIQKLYSAEEMEALRVNCTELRGRPLFVTLDQPHGRLTVAGVQYMLRQLGRRAGVDNLHSPPV